MSYPNVPPRHRALSLIVAAFFVVSPLAHSAEKPRKSSVHTASSSAPLNLGNNIFVLGEEGGASASIQPQRSQPAPQKRPPVRAATNTNALLVGFCRAYLGRKLGNGQCSELAALGLPAVGAQLDWKHLWGTPVCNYGVIGGRHYLQLGEAGRNSRNTLKPDVRPGDIIQYENVKFERVWNGGSSFKTYPHHTSVIESVSRDGLTYKVLEQNVDGTQIVVETVLYLPDLTEGTMSITRPIPRTA